MSYPECDSFLCFSTRRGYLASPIYEALDGRPCQMTFDYQTRGSASGLNVNMYFPEAGFGNSVLRTFWASTEITGNRWTQQSIEINSTQSFQVRDCDHYNHHRVSGSNYHETLHSDYKVDGNLLSSCAWSQLSRYDRIATSYFTSVLAE